MPLIEVFDTDNADFSEILEKFSKLLYSETVAVKMGRIRFRFA